MASIKPVSETELCSWAASLNSPQVGLVERARALWGLRHAAEPLAAQLLAAFVRDNLPPTSTTTAMTSTTTSAANDLLQHEAAYCLGQRGDTQVWPILAEVVKDKRHSSIVRHEAGEALAALAGGCDEKLRNEIAVVLQQFVNDDIVELAHTCQVGLGRLAWLAEQPALPRLSTAGVALDTVDPAPSFARGQHAPTRLLDLLLDAQGTSLFDRYKALFSLRNLVLEASLPVDQRDAAACLLAQGLTAPGSALLRHEVAFVLGQLGRPVTASALVECVNRTPAEEHAMVRHEAAEALGTVIGEAKLAAEVAPDEPMAAKMHAIVAEATECLRQHLTDPEQVVMESCVLALDIAEYVASKEQLQYATVPATV